ncbi:MAG: hypothetical protein ACK5NN_11285 [Sphingomonadaceae bacterium]
MSARVEIKLRVDAALVTRIDRAAAQANQSRNEYIAQVLADDLRQKFGPDGVPRQHTIADISAMREANHAQKRQEIRSKGLETLLQGVSAKVAAQPDQKWLLAQLQTLANQNNKTCSALNALERTIIDSANSLQSVFGEMEARCLRALNRPLWKNRFARIGCAVGVIATVIVLAFLPAQSSPAREIAKLTLGERDPIAAAAVLAGRDNHLAVDVLRTSMQLSSYPAFVRSYAHCLDEAHLHKTDHACAVTFPGLE